MKDHYLTILRSQETKLSDFRFAANRLSVLIASEVASQMPLVPYSVATPLAVCSGTCLHERVILIPILRAGLVLLFAFMEIFPKAPTGFLGIRRDEETVLPQLYYANLPSLSSSDRILLLDPMLATGGSALLSLHTLKEKKVDLSRVTLVTVLAAPEGIEAVKQTFPNVKIYSIAIDERLNVKKYIVPGLGDFGDRYFGT